jgi:hypothetical protein
MQYEKLTAISPIDGRYADKCGELTEVFSEYGLVKRRVLVECVWLEALCDDKEIKECKALSASERKALARIAAEFSPADAQRVKDIEKTTNHDVKAVEYFLKEKVAGTSLEKRAEFIHFGCTSEDINNMSHALMLRDGKAVIRKAMDEVTGKIAAMAKFRFAADLANMMVRIRKIRFTPGMAYRISVPIQFRIEGRFLPFFDMMHAPLISQGATAPVAASSLQIPLLYPFVGIPSNGTAIF